MVFLQYKMSQALMTERLAFTTLFLHNIQTSPCKAVLQHKITQTNKMQMINKSSFAA